MGATHASGAFQWMAAHHRLGSPSLALACFSPAPCSLIRAPRGREEPRGLARNALFGMIAGMTMAKIAVSLPRDVVRRARRAVGRGRAPSMSAYVAAAVEQKTKLDELEDLLQEMLAETGGPLTASERRAAQAALLGTGTKNKRRAR